MNTVVITWKTIHKHGELWMQSHQLRHAAFVDRLQYNVPSHDGLEWDQYDTPRARYIVIEHAGRCAAVCRLVPTTAPYMLEELFPQLLPYAAPKAADVWEATRIAVDSALPPAERDAALKALIVGVQRFGLEHGIRHFLGLMPVAIFRRTLIRHGVAVNILVDTAQPIDGVPTAAGEILVDAATVARLAPTLAIAA